MRGKWTIPLSTAVSMLVGGAIAYMAARNVIGQHVQGWSYAKDGLFCGAVFGLMIAFIRSLVLRWIAAIFGAMVFAGAYHFFLLALIGI